MRIAIVLSSLLLATLMTVPAHAGGAAGQGVAPASVAASCPANGPKSDEAALAWLVVVEPSPSPTPVPAPTACGDCPGNCTSSPACGGVVGDSCYLFGRTWECKEVGRCAKYICCGCG